jgi:hypothetical protein
MISRNSSVSSFRVSSSKSNDLNNLKHWNVKLETEVTPQFRFKFQSFKSNCKVLVLFNLKHWNVNLETEETPQLQSFRTDYSESPASSNDDDSFAAGS